MVFITNNKKIIAAEGDKKVTVTVIDNRIKVSGNVIVSEKDMNEAWLKGWSLVKIAKLAFLDDRINKNMRSTRLTKSDGFAIRMDNGIILAK